MVGTSNNQVRVYSRDSVDVTMTITGSSEHYNDPQEPLTAGAVFHDGERVYLGNGAHEEWIFNARTGTESYRATMGTVADPVVTSTFIPRINRWLLPGNARHT